MNTIDKLTEYRKDLKEYQDLINPDLDAKLTIMIPDKTIISIHREVPPNEGGRHFHQKPFALSDLDGIMKNLKERIRYWTDKNKTI